MKWQKNEFGVLKPGDTFEKYTVEKSLGRGGMGAVYLVRHNILDSLFALKVLFPEVASKNRQFVDRFIREAKLACKIKHPNLIAVYDAGRNPDNGMYYLVMDYVSGESVRDLLKKSGRISPRQAISIVKQVASALETAGQHHMVHRDIKPDNIMFTSDGTAKLADLGIAKSTNEQDTMLTLESSVFGTPAYMSPEQAMDSRKVDSRADIYSLGIVLFEMISGQRPYHGEGTIEILSQVVNDEDIPDIRTISPFVPEAIAKLIADMTEKKLSKRLQSASVLLSRIRDVGLSNESMGNIAQTRNVDVEDVTMPTLVKPAFLVLREEPSPCATVPVSNEKQEVLPGNLAFDVTVPTTVRQKAISSKPILASMPEAASTSSGKKDTPKLPITHIEESRVDEFPIKITREGKTKNTEAEGNCHIPIAENSATQENDDFPHAEAILSDPFDEVTLPTLVKQPESAEPSSPQLISEASPTLTSDIPLKKTKNECAPEKTFSSNFPDIEKTEQSLAFTQIPRNSYRKIILFWVGGIFFAILLVCVIIFSLQKKQTSSKEPSLILRTNTPESGTSSISSSLMSDSIKTAQTTEASVPVSVNPFPQKNDKMESDELVNNAVIILSGATENAKKIKNSLKIVSKYPVIYLEAESLYPRQLKKILRYKPHFVVLIPSARWSELGKSRATFETMLKEEVNLLRDNQIDFVFVLDRESESDPKIAEFNQAIKELCSLRSFEYFESDSSKLKDMIR